MDIVRFESPALLYLLFLLVPMIAFYIYKFRKGKATLQISTIEGVKNTPRTVKYYLRHLPFVLRMLTVTLLIIALARPQSSQDDQTISTEGVDIVIALDISGSMLARDFSPDRISAAKDVATKFILDRRNDRLGLVVFAGESFTQVPLTTDHVTLINLLNQVQSGIITDGTAIGNGLATAVSRLKDSEAKSKVVILLTDGVNNAGQIAPLTAAEAASALGVKVYTIGIGSMGTAPTPAIDAWGRQIFVQAPVKIDEAVLRKIAQSTGGRYYRATDNKSLQDIYDQINSMEKTKIDVTNYVLYSEQYLVFALLALCSLIAEILVRHLYLRQIP
ncbi:MAG TPA: VWA domain-containing protein [Candidatus Avirikenella pullistercoris]|nr:VWA domain-containing protein [Candidatus Avirikenella pullistercoris]